MTDVLGGQGKGPFIDRVLVNNRGLKKTEGKVLPL